MIDVQHVTKRYGQVTVLDDISFSIHKGETVAFLGPNGAGKTTTMRILTGFMPPTSGTVYIAGFDCLEEPWEVKKHIGYLPETPPLRSVDRHDLASMDNDDFLTDGGSLRQQMRTQEDGMGASQVFD